MAAAAQALLRRGGVRRGPAGDARLIAYSSGNFGKHLVFAGADVTFLFLLTDLFGLSATTAGALMLVALAGDLVFDLLAARLMIRLRRSGRGYRWLILAGAIPGGAGFALLYAMPLLGAERIWMLAGALLLFRGAYAVVDLPHNALMARVTTDSRARGRVSGYRLLFSTASSLVVASLLTPAVQQAAQGHSVGALALTGAIAGGLFALTLILCAVASGGASDPEPAQTAFSDGIAVPLRDRLVLGIGLIALITGFAVPAFQRMLIYEATYVLGRPDVVRPVLLAITAGQFAGVLGWTALTGRFDKSVLLTAGHAVAAVGVALFAACLGWPPGRIACAFVLGIGFASVFMLPWGLLADTVDFVELRHGRRYETGLFAAFLVVIKVGGAASSGVIGWSLGSLGYVPDQPQALAVKMGMLALGIGLPFAGCLAAIAVLRRFDMGHARHARVIAALARRRSRAARTMAERQREAPVQGSSGSSGSTRVAAREGRKARSIGETLVPTVPG